MPKMYLREQTFTYSTCRLFTKNNEQIQKFKETVDSGYIYQNDLDKASFQQTWLMEILKTYLEEQLLIKYYMIKHSILLKIQNTMDIKEDLLQWFIIFFHKKSSGSGAKSDIISNWQQLAEELHKPILRKFEKRKVYSAFMKNIWGDMQQICN